MYFSSNATRYRYRYDPSASSSNYTGTDGVTQNVTASFTFYGNRSRESGQLWSEVVSAVLATRNSYAITWKYLSSYPNTWTTTNQTYYYGETPSRSSASTVTLNRERKVFSSWDDLSVVTENRTITALYTQQYNVDIYATRCIASKSSGWHDDGTEVTWVANYNYAFDSQGTVQSVTETITSSVGVSISWSADYCYATFSGTHCTANKSAGWYSYGTSFTWAADRGYAFSGNSDTQSATMVGGSNTASASYTKYFTIT